MGVLSADFVYVSRCYGLGLPLLMYLVLMRLCVLLLVCFTVVFWLFGCLLDLIFDCCGACSRFVCCRLFCDCLFVRFN